jgi:hypothetical protein
MKRAFLLFIGIFLSPAWAFAQVSISSADMFNQVGLYYRAYANNYDPLDTSGGTAYPVPSGLIGSAGTNQFWDFSVGPTNKVFRFDYVDPTALSQAADFSNAKIAEQMTDEVGGEQMWLFFEQVPGIGRKVYGFYAQNSQTAPSNVFVPPEVDFPDTISYGQEWTASTTYDGTVSVGDPDPEGGGSFAVPIQTTQTSNFKADASGTIVLPDGPGMGAFGAALRVSEAVTIDISADLGDGLQHFETDYTHNYYWLMQNHGIVAQLNSTQSPTPPPDNFTRAVAFLRMFETNKKASTGGTGGGCTSPQSVTDLRIRASGGTILLTWSKAPCATLYRVEYTLTPGVSSSWKSLGDPTSGTFWQGENLANGPTRFYRVVSL